jgi:flagellar motor component MotA
MTKKQKLLLLILNLVVIIVNSIIQGTNSGELKLPSWIVQTLTPILSTIMIFTKSDYFKNTKIFKRIHKENKEENTNE